MRKSKAPTAASWTPKNPALVLRTCDKDMRAHGGFQWPREEGAIVEAPDWNPMAECGNGLHGLLDGHGDFGLLSYEHDAHWLVVEVDRDECIDLGGKVKFQRCIVRHVGNMASAMTLAHSSWIDEAIKRGDPNIASGDFSRAASSGNSSSAASSGNSSSAASSGDSSSAASSGDSSSAASSGNFSRAASSGNSSSAASSGDSSRAASSGNYSSATSSGNYSSAASSGDSSSAASAGYSSRAASSGDSSSAASSGDSSSAAAEGVMTVSMVAGIGGRAKAGERGAFALAWQDGKQMRIAVGVVGEHGIKANKWYRVTDTGELEMCS